VKAMLLKQYVINKTLWSSTTSQIWKSVFLATNNKIQYRTRNSWRNGLRNLELQITIGVHKLFLQSKIFHNVIYFRTTAKSNLQEPTNS